MATKPNADQATQLIGERSRTFGEALQRLRAAETQYHDAQLQVTALESQLRGAQQEVTQARAALEESIATADSRPE